MFVGYLLAFGSARASLGLEPANKYLSRTLDAYDAEAHANKHLPASAKIVLFDEVRGFYLDREYMWGNPGHHEMTPWSSFKTGADMVGYFRRMGFTHALINWRLAKYSGNDLLHGTLIPESIHRGLMQKIYSSNDVSIYELANE